MFLICLLSCNSNVFGGQKGRENIENYEQETIDIISNIDISNQDRLTLVRGIFEENRDKIIENPSSFIKLIKEYTKYSDGSSSRIEKEALYNNLIEVLLWAVNLNNERVLISIVDEIIKEDINLYFLTKLVNKRMFKEIGIIFVRSLFNKKIDNLDLYLFLKASEHDGDKYSLIIDNINSILDYEQGQLIEDDSINLKISLAQILLSEDSGDVNSKKIEKLLQENKNLVSEIQKNPLFYIKLIKNLTLFHSKTVFSNFLISIIIEDLSILQPDKMEKIIEELSFKGEAIAQGFISYFLKEKAYKELSIIIKAALKISNIEIKNMNIIYMISELKNASTIEEGVFRRILSFLNDSEKQAFKDMIEAHTRR